MKYIAGLIFALVAIFASHSARADVQITVLFGSTPTCLGRLYNQIIVPGGYGTATDTTAATRFFRTDEGTLGLTLFFEIQPVSVTDNITNEALLSVGFTAVNRTRVTNVVPAQYKTVKSITKNMSAVWSNSNTTPTDGTGDLAAKEKTELPQYLGEAPTSQHCEGLIYSLVLAQNMALGALNEVVQPAYPIQAAGGMINGPPLRSPMPSTLFFLSNPNPPSVSSSRKANLVELGYLGVPRFGGVTAPYYFWTINDYVFQISTFFLY